MAGHSSARYQISGSQESDNLSNYLLIPLLPKFNLPLKIPVISFTIDGNQLKKTITLFNIHMAGYLAHRAATVEVFTSQVHENYLVVLNVFETTSYRAHSKNYA